MKSAHAARLDGCSAATTDESPNSKQRERHSRMSLCATRERRKSGAVATHTILEAKQGAAPPAGAKPAIAAKRASRSESPTASTEDGVDGKVEDDGDELGDGGETAGPACDESRGAATAGEEDAEETIADEAAALWSSKRTNPTV